MPRWMPAALVAVALLLSACTSGPAAASRPTPSAPAAAPTDDAPLPDGVTSRVLQLVDPSRTTDPTPLDRGNADATSGRSLPTTLYYPASGTGPFPVVVFGHGLDAVPSGYRYLLQSWAAAGFVVAAPLFPLTSSAAPWCRRTCSTSRRTSPSCSRRCWLWAPRPATTWPAGSTPSTSPWRGTPPVPSRPSACCPRAAPTSGSTPPSSWQASSSASPPSTRTPPCRRPFCPGPPTTRSRSPGAARPPPPPPAPRPSSR